MPQIRDYIKKVRDPNYNPDQDSNMQLGAANERLEKAKAVYLEQQDAIKEMTVEIGKLKTDLELVQAENTNLIETNRELQELLPEQEDEQLQTTVIETDDESEDDIELV